MHRLTRSAVGRTSRYGGRHVLQSPWLALGFWAFCPAPARAESAVDRRLTIIGGAGLTRASLAFTAPTALVKTRVDALPTLHLGVEAWPETSLGLHAAVDLGTGASLGLPGTSQTLAYNTHQVRAGGWYRWQPAPGGSGWDVRLGLGLHGRWQTVQAQHPALLVDSRVAGPALEGRLDKYFQGRRVRLGLAALAEVPFFVRETPRDSGDPGRFYAWGGLVEATWGLGPTLDLGLEVRHTDQRVEFRGEGTRAAGITDGRTHDQFTTALLTTAWRL